MNNAPILQRYHTAPNPEAFAGINAVARENRLSNERTRLTLAESESYGLHRQYRRPARRNAYYVYYLRQMIQVDLIDKQALAPDNDGVTFLLVALDCFPKKVRIPFFAL